MMAAREQDLWGPVLPPVEHATASNGPELDGWRCAKLSPIDPGYRWMPSRKREWWIYFAQGDDGGPIKIGRTTDLAARISSLIPNYPFGLLRYVGIMRAPGDMETELHVHFSRFRLRGEWFRPGAELVAFIRDLAVP